MNFAENLTRLRANRGLTRQQVADELGITLQAYSAYEMGKREPRRDNILKLASIFGVTTDTLLCYKPDTYNAVKADLERIMPIQIVERENGRVDVSIELDDDARHHCPTLEMNHDDLIRLYRWAYSMSVRAEQRFRYAFLSEYAMSVCMDSDEKRKIPEYIELEEPEPTGDPNDFSIFEEK